MTKSETPKTGTINSVDHAISVIELLSEKGTATVSEIARTTDLPRPTVYRLLRSLSAHGLTSVEGKRHCLTLRLHELAVTARSVDKLQQRVQPILDRITAATGLTSHFAVLDEKTAAFVAKRDALGAMAMASRIGWRGPLHCTAVGKVLLSATDQREELDLSPQTKNTITDSSQLDEALSSIRRDGFALDDEELLLGLRCVAVPWHDNGTLLGAISVSGRTAEIDNPEKLAVVVKSAIRNDFGKDSTK